MYRKILEIGPIPPPRAGWGVRIEYVMDALRDRGIECRALDLGLNRLNRTDEDVGIHGIRHSLDYAIQVPLYLLRGFRIHNHLNSESWKAYCLVLYASVLSCLFFRPAVLTWHGGLGGRWFPNPNSRLVDLVHWLVFRLNQVTICNDDVIKEHIVAYGVSEQRVVSIPAFSRQYVEFDPVSLPAELERCLEQSAPVLFSYVFFRPEFYVDVLLQGVRRLKENHPDLVLLLVGCSKGNEESIELLRRYGLEQCVRFVGDLNRGEFLTLLSRVDLCIRTPKQDGISSSVLEALSLGIPVVAAANSLRPEQVVTYTVDDPDELAAAAEQVLALPKDRRKPDAPEIRDTVADEIDVLTAKGAYVSNSNPGQAVVS